MGEITIRQPQDSEINKEGGLKYNDKKIFPLLYEDHALAFAYRGTNRTSSGD